ncbi:hypothetical protein AAVH_16056 [Aphelenchoides avenae]|nr:hypothetical protein AAVH_16056 [Aphelenchus avenae]
MIQSRTSIEMARPKQTAAYCRRGKPSWKWSRARPVASACSQEPKTEDAKDVAKASVHLTIEDFGNFLSKPGNMKTSTSTTACGMQWQLSVETSAADDGTAEVVMGCSVRAAHENGAWSRWITADFFVCDDHSYGYKAGDVREKMVGSAPLPCSAGEPRLTSDQEILDYVDSFADWKNQSASFRVDFSCWKDSFQEKREFDDVVFDVQGRPVLHANKGVRPALFGSQCVPSCFSTSRTSRRCCARCSRATSAKDSRAGCPSRRLALSISLRSCGPISPVREPVTADVYDVGFLRRDCEKHLMATKGVEAIDKLLLASR